jgi:hypothetical protein
VLEYVVKELCALRVKSREGGLRERIGFGARSVIK